MNIIRLSIERPIAVVAMVLMIILFGAVAMDRIPIQMAPDVRQPVIIVKTSWPGAAPQEVEREIVQKQEDELKGLEGLRKMSSRAQHNQGGNHARIRPGHQFRPPCCSSRTGSTGSPAIRKRPTSRRCLRPARKTTRSRGSC